MRHAKSSPSPASGNGRETTNEAKDGRKDPQDAPTRAPDGDAAPTATSLVIVGERFIKSMERRATRSTLAAYSADLAIAAKVLGAETDVRSLTAEQVKAFNESRAVTRKRDGTRKSEPAILRTRRVLRLMFVWAAERGIVAEAPLLESGKKENAKQVKRVDAPSTAAKPRREATKIANAKSSATAKSQAPTEKPTNGVTGSGHTAVSEHAPRVVAVLNSGEDGAAAADDSAGDGSAENSGDDPPSAGTHGAILRI